MSHPRDRIVAAPRRSQPPFPDGRPTGTALPLTILALAVAAAFWPVLSAGFVNWDDGVNFLENHHYRGLDWTHLRWMWTTIHMGHYQPLSWMTLGLDYSVWGMDPFGYHLTSLLLHAANAALFYLVSRRLLGSAWTALLAALLFAVHPLRVESVAWVTERRDVLSGFFYLATILLYLKACAEPKGHTLRAAVVCFVLSLLSKSMGMTLPLALVVLDVYPLRRLPSSPARWTEPESLAVLREKAPFAAAALLSAAVAFLAQKHTGVIARFASAGIVERLESSAYGLVFYVLKTVAPFHLLALYARPVRFDAWDGRFLRSAAAVAAAGAGLFAARRRWPALTAAGLFYAITLLPVSGLVLAGIYLAADRYSYLPCLGWAVAAAGAAGEAHRSLGRSGRRALVGVLVLVVVGLVPLTRRQSSVWHDSVALWSHVLAVDPQSAPAHNNLGTALARAGREADAAVEFSRAIELDHDYAEAHNNLATAWVHQGRRLEAVAEYREALRADPRYAMARDNLGAVLAELGRVDEAIAEYRRALEIDPEDAHAHDNLGAALAGQGKLDEAAAEFRRVLAINPDYAGAAEHLRTVLGR